MNGIVVLLTGLILLASDDDARWRGFNQCVPVQVHRLQVPADVAVDLCWWGIFEMSR